MARMSPEEATETVCRHDPVSQRVTCYERPRHDRTRARRLRLYRQCMRQALAGRRYRGQGAVADTQAVRQAFREAAQACARSARLETQDHALAREEADHGQGRH